MLLNWRWFARQMVMRRGSAVAFVALTAAVFGCGIVFPILTQRAVDTIVTGKDLPGFAVYLGVALVALVLEAVFSQLRHNYLIAINAFIDERLSSQFIMQMLRLRADRKSAGGGNISVTFQNVTRVRSFILSLIPRIIFDLGGAVVAFAVMAVYSVPVAIAILVIFVATALIMKKQVAELGPASQEQFKADGARMGFLNESYNGLEAVKMLVIEGRRRRRWQELTRDFIQKISRVHVLAQTFALTSLTAARITSLTVVAIGCYQISLGDITIGDLIALQLLAFRATAPVSGIGDVVRQYKEAGVALSAIEEFLSREREKRGEGIVLRKLPASKAIAFEGVSLTYQGAAAPAVRGISFATPDRGLVALVGKNGAGKSTLIGILLGLQRDYEGSVTLGGVEVRHIHPRTLRNAIGTANQEATLFSGTIRSNLDVGMGEKSEEAMAAAIDFAGARQLVAGQDGLDREVKELGRNLSGGQRQRIAVARALIGDPPIVVLDEPTAFLDAEAGRRLDQALVKLAQDRLLILVSHNLSATRDAAQIVVLDEGRVAGVGRHADLLETCGEYRSLWKDHVASLNFE